MKSLKYMSLFVAGVSFSAIAHAQADTDDEEDRIVVTGSRIITDGSQAPTPVTVVTTDALTETAPSSIADGLNQLPQFAGSRNQNSGGTFNAGSAPLGNYLNLRGLNSSRLLVLLDGQRVAPTTRDNSVDINMLPQMLVERVDIVTGGASAVYGSDAVSGVVNYVLDNDYVGIKGTAQAGISDYGDAFSYRLGGAFGFDAGERIHVMGSYEYYENDGVPHIFDRDWAIDNLSGTDGSGTAEDPNVILGAPTNFRFMSNSGTVYGILGSVGFGAPYPFNPAMGQFGQVLGRDLSSGSPGAPQFYGNVFTDDGYLRTQDAGIDPGIGGDGGTFGTPENGGTSISGTLRTHQAFLRASFEVSDAIEFQLQGIYGNSQTSFNSSPNNHIRTNRATYIYADNPYLRPEYQQIMVDAGQERFLMGRIFNDIGLVTNVTDNEYMSGRASLFGDIDGNWRWDLTYNYGRAEQTSTFNEFEMRNFFAAIDAVRDPDSGEIVCRISIVDPGFLPGCAPLNIIGENNFSEAARDFTRQDSISTIVNEMQYVNANLTGTLFELPAGPVGISVGAEYRHQELEITSNSDPAFFDNAGITQAEWFGQIRGVPQLPTVQATLFDSINVGLASGAQDVKEGYGELQIPVLADTPGFQSLDLTLAARYTDYKTSGSVTTWKVGASWEPVYGVRFRFNQSRDIAAPSLYALFAGRNATAGGFNDIHVIDPADGEPGFFTVPTFSDQGNPNLNPEKADTTTLGVVIQPAAVPGLTFSADFYRVKVEDVIAQANPALQLQQCEDSGGTDPVCDFFIRNPNLPFSDRTTANAVTEVIQSPQNLASLETQGVDFELGYSFPMFGGTASLRAFVNYLHKLDTQESVDAEVRENDGRSYAIDNAYGLPKWRGLLSQSFRNDRFSVTATQRFTGSYTFGPDGVVYDPPLEMPNIVYVGLNTTYNFDEEGQIVGFLNIQNLFNVEPPATPVGVAYIGVPTDKVIYDVNGRYFTAGVRFEF